METTRDVRCKPGAAAQHPRLEIGRPTRPTRRSAEEHNLAREADALSWGKDLSFRRI